MPRLGENLVFIFGTNLERDHATKGAEKLAATNFQAKIFSRENQINIKMNGDVDMIDASSNSDTVAILDAGAQYGKVIKFDLAVILYDF